ncbi:MAG TPA: ribonuclease Y [Actinomycetota bacterium]|nr:ribonuclease Y [Actinomycetota bacterium]
MPTDVLLGLVGLLVGVGIGFVLYKQAASRSAVSAQARARDRLIEAEEEAEGIRREALVAAKEEAARIRQEAELEVKERSIDVQRKESRILQREELLDQTAQRLVEKEQHLADKEAQFEAQKMQLDQLAIRQRQELERLAGMSQHQAKELVIAQVENQAKRDAMTLVRDVEARAREEADRRARKIVAIAIQRVASEETSENSISVVTLPNDEMKGRIIGREGRNIRAFESATGTSLLIDDTPESVVLSCFDPIRREVAKLTLEKLVSDGRIQPARIEEMYEKSKGEVERSIREAGEWAALEAGISDLHPEMLKVLGRLNYRTSYGQNVLKHLVEASHIAGVIAAELGTDIQLAKRCTLLHDIGKAITHEVEGSHALIGAELARRLKESPAVVHAIEAHHQEVEQRTIEAVITQTADAISSARPGARRETLETYVKRLERLEALAESFAGVEKCYAMQAGREVRVMVNPNRIDDLGAEVLARDIAKKIEEELQYPGQIKVMVIREHRAVEFAK